MSCFRSVALRPRAPDAYSASVLSRERLSLLFSPTPTVTLDDEKSGCTLSLKLDYLLPSGSTKDRFVATVLCDAMERGAIGPSSLVVEASSGSTSIAFAMACALIGVRFCAVMPEGVSGERVLLIRRYGGDVELTPRADGLLGAIERTEAMAAASDDVFLPRQFTNPLNVEAHRTRTGPELIDQSAAIDGFVAGVGTAGTLMGVGLALRERGSDAVIARVRPTTGVCFAGQPEICGGIPGVVDGVSGLYHPSAVGLGEEIEIADVDAVLTARELCGLGFPVGPSSGLNVAAARHLARELGPGHNVATVLCDRMERYFSTDLFADLSGAARPNM